MDFSLFLIGMLILAILVLPVFYIHRAQKNKKKKQPTFQEVVKLFKQNDYVEIGYITGIKRVYLS